MSNKYPKASYIPDTVKEDCKTRTQSNWAQQIKKRWKRKAPVSLDQQAKVLQAGILLLKKFHPSFHSYQILRFLDSQPKKRKSHPYLLSGQPFDAHLLEFSSLYRRSRRLFLQRGGEHVPVLLSSSRALGSAGLLSTQIEYSPTERELVWAATQGKGKSHLSYLLTLRSYNTSLFHEQSHRILWTLLPRAPSDNDGLRRYLNFVESLVVTLDMALGDELGIDLASLFYLCGVTYDPGTDVRQQVKAKRVYRNYLQAAMYATYLNLEMYSKRDIFKVLNHLFPQLRDQDLCERAVQRSVRLDRKFVLKTNPYWQYKNKEVVKWVLCPGQSDQNWAVLDLTGDPLDNHLHYFWTEKWFDLMRV